MGIFSTSTNGGTVRIDGKTYSLGNGRSRAELERAVRAARLKEANEEARKRDTKRKQKAQREHKRSQEGRKPKTNWLGQPKGKR